MLTPVETATFWILLVVAVAGVAVVAALTPRNTQPTPIDDTWTSINAFYRNRPARDAEVELGTGWRSAADPGAAFELSWIKQSRELVVLRHQAHPDMVGAFGLLAPMPGGLDKRATGMKVLAVVDFEALQSTRPDRLHPRPDGLDRLTSLLGRPYRAPHDADDHWSGFGSSPSMN